jgi:hypothetical protein
MATDFTPTTRVPTSVPSFETILRVVKGTPSVYEARYSFDVLDAEGRIMDVVSGDLTPKATAWTLTAAQKTALGNCTTVAAVLKILQDFLIAKAQGSIA